MSKTWTLKWWTLLIVISCDNITCTICDKSDKIVVNTWFRLWVNAKTYISSDVRVSVEKKPRKKLFVKPHMRRFEEWWLSTGQCTRPRWRWICSRSATGVSDHHHHHLHQRHHQQNHQQHRWQIPSPSPSRTDASNILTMCKRIKQASPCQQASVLLTFRIRDKSNK